MQGALSSQSSAVALLRIDELRLVLPQKEIRTLESYSDVDASGSALMSAGWITYRQGKWPVYCLTGNLDLTLEVPDSRRACAMVEIGSGYMGILCDDVLVLKDFAGKYAELPVIMSKPGTPVSGLVEYDHGIACVTNTEKLTVFVDKLVAAN